MNELPPGWARVHADQIKANSPNALAIGPFGSNLKVSDYRDAGVPLVFVRNIRAKAFGGNLKYVSKAKANILRAHHVKQGDLLVTKMGDPPGDAAIYPLTEAGIITADCIKLTPHPSVDSRYLMYALGSPAVKRQIREITQGVAQPKMSLDRFRNGVEIFLAPSAEQQRIVAAIEEQFSRIDAGVAALDRVQQNLKRIRAAVLDAAMLSAQDNGALSVALGDLVMPGRKASYGVLVPGDDVPGGVPFVRVGDLSDRMINTASLKRISPSIAARYPRTCLKGGEVLLSLVGTIGRTAVVPHDLAGANTARALAVLPVREDVDPRYVAIALSPHRVTAELTNLSHEVARKTLNLEDVRKYTIPVPVQAQQLKIIDFVETAEMRIAAVEHLVISASRRGGHLYSSILATAFSGKLVSQDSNDEPAAALLERIAREKVASNGHRPHTQRARRNKVTP